MIVLGINAAFHDSAAALVHNGVVLAASEEERFTRIKHAKRPVPFSAWELPFHAIDDCLRQAGVRMADVNHVAYSYNPHPQLAERARRGLSGLDLSMTPSDAVCDDPEGPWHPLFLSHVLNAPRQLRDGVPHHLRSRWQGLPREPDWTWHHVDHHLCHQTSAFLAAPFDRCAVMTIDGRGESATTCYGHAQPAAYTALGQVDMPHSIGLLYERMTTHLGFLHSSDEYKVMALAAMGQPRFRAALREAVRLQAEGRYEVGQLALHELVGPPRLPGQMLTEAHLDLAASLQDVLEETVLSLATWLREKTGERQLAMAGGVALNCLMNTRLRDSGLFEEVWVQPAAGDAGTALGAALWVDARARSGQPRREGDTDLVPGRRAALGPRCWQMQSACLGPAFDDDEIEGLLKWAKLPHRRLADVPGEVAALLAQDRIIGWFQGRMEFGPRALGARSILASPLSADMQKRLNELKDREDFRPVAPVVLQERLGDWFQPAQANQGRSPFMLFTYDVLPSVAHRIPAACHVDRTARVQTVSQTDNPLLHRLLTAFEQRTGVPVLVNTSFNVRGQPVVCTPRDALEAFFTTPLDALVIGNHLVEKAVDQGGEP
jgi:carbamoyltransferase